MKAIFGAGLALLVLAACAGDQAAKGPAPEAVAQASADLTAYLDAEYQEELAESPEEMTRQGIKTRYGELDDRSEAAADKRLEWRKQSVNDMKAKFTPAMLNEDAKLSYEIWELELKRAEESAKWRRNRYVFSRGNATTGIPNFLINQHRVDEKADMEAYVSRVGLIDDALDQLLVRAKAAQADGIHMPGFTYEQSLSEIKRVTTGAPFTAGKDAALFADAKTKIQALSRPARSRRTKARRSRQVSAVMKKQMKPAYDRVAAFITEDKPNGQKPKSQGAQALPKGRSSTTPRSISRPRPT